MVSTSENQLPAYSSIPSAPSAVTGTTQSVYYTVGLSNGPGTTKLAAAANPGASSITGTNNTSFYVGEAILLDGGTASAELAIITSIAGNVLGVAALQDGGTLRIGHASGATVVGTYAALTPSYTGRVEVTVEGTLTGNQTGDTVGAQIIAIAANSYVGPAAGITIANCGGVVVGNLQQLQMLTGVLTQAFSCYAMLGGPAAATNSTPSGGAALLVGTPYVFDLVVADASVAGKTIQPKALIVAVREY